MSRARRKAARWTAANVPDLTGRRVAITGVTSGLGYRTAFEFAHAGANLVLIARSETRLSRTADQLRAEVPGVTLETVVVDLADQSSIRAGAPLISAMGALDVLVNNAGVMAVPYARTVDGFETQFATNHLGPFLLTGLLLPALVASGDGRVVSLASQAHRFARRPPLGNPWREPPKYHPMLTYGSTKLADLIFTFEFDRRLRAAGLPVMAVAAHPGYAKTALMSKAGGARGRFMGGATRLLGQKTDYGALPTMLAATADLPGGTYVGPRHFLQLSGLPKVVRARRIAYDPTVGQRLWAISEAVTGIRFP